VATAITGEIGTLVVFGGAILWARVLVPMTKPEATAKSTV
jgi:uncharacterized membrane protein